MHDVARRLQEMVEGLDEEVQTKRLTKHGSRHALLPLNSSSTGRGAALSPWRAGGQVATALESLASRLEDRDHGAKLNDLREKVKEALGAKAVDPIFGCYNAAR